MQRFGDRLTYGNVTGTLALVLVVGWGGSSVAAALAANSVGSPPIIDGAVKNRDLGADSVRTGKIDNGRSSTGTSTRVRSALSAATPGTRIRPHS